MQDACGPDRGRQSFALHGEGNVSQGGTSLRVYDSFDSCMLDPVFQLGQRRRQIVQNIFVEQGPQGYRHTWIVQPRERRHGEDLGAGIPVAVRVAGNQAAVPAPLRP